MTPKTDWEAYYKRPFKASGITRSITTGRLIKYINKYANNIESLEIAELGGANSCFYDSIVRQVPHSKYYIIDNNELGLKKFKDRYPDNPKVEVFNCDVLNMSSDIQADIVFSVGLIEHFSPKETQAAIDAHFELLRPGGIAIISFPTPTFLYKATRRLSELLGMWIFHDERPLTGTEVFPVIKNKGSLEEWQIIWPIFLTQLMLVARKAPLPENKNKPN